MSDGPTGSALGWLRPRRISKHQPTAGGKQLYDVGDQVCGDPRPQLTDSRYDLGGSSVLDDPQPEGGGRPRFAVDRRQKP